MIKPILLPQKIQNNEIKGGVGTPYIIYDVKRDKHWLLFTGWNDPIGLKREGFVAPIDDSMNVDLSALIKILPSDFPENVNYSNNAVRGFYNEAKDEFYITSSHGKNLYFLVFDSNWKLKGYKNLINDFNKDSGLAIRPTGAYLNIKDAIAVSPSNEFSSLELYVIRNVDDFEKLNIEDWGKIGASWGKSNDVLDFTLIPRFQIFVEATPMSKWLLQTYVGPSMDEVFSDNISSIDAFKNVSFLQGSLMPLLGLDDSFTQVGHPHYTTEPDGKPKLLFASFRDTYSSRPDTGKEGYTHEIWMEYVDNTIFDPKSYNELRGKFKGTESRWFYLPNVRKLFISINNDAKLILKTAFDDKNTESLEIKKGINTIENPVNWVKISSQNEIDAIIKAVF
ncbi:hypothetical protein B6F84_04955 [Acidianus manzaensis]|uniref:Uncharacterized protein n=1 Tax=Acidianus manzaensis TaxID=282676 RepID=A0A1W6K3L1_9CREN|nr:hypothetical protein B6F84_04955 [Acidianus manzaensis]